MLINNRIQFFLISIILSSLSAENIYSQKINFTEIKSEQDWVNVLKKAEKDKKTIFLDIYATWCGPCKKMDNEVFADNSVAEYYNANFINTKIDGESEFGSVLVRDFSLKGYPSMYYIDNDKFIYSVLFGFKPSVLLLEYGKTIEKNKTRLKQYAVSFEAGTLQGAGIQEYIDLLTEIDYTEPIGKISGLFINSMELADILNPDNKQLIINSSITFESDPFQAILSNQDTLSDLWGIEDFTNFLETVFQEALLRAAKSEDVQLRDRLAEELIPVYFQFDPESVTYGKFLTRKLYQASAGNWAGYVTEIDSYFNYEMEGNVDFLIQEVYQILQNQYSSNELYLSSARWLDKIPEDRQTFESYYMGAIVNAYIKDFDKSEKMIIAAEKLANPVQQDAIVDLKDYIHTMKEGVE